MFFALFLAAALLQAPRPASAFNAYSVHLEPGTLAGRCVPNEASTFLNLTYVFRGRVYPWQQPIPLRDGLYVETGDFGADWMFELERQESITLGGTPGVFLTFFANHLSGSGSAEHALVIRCRDAVIEVVLEASGEGVRANYAGDAITITHPFWLADDSHASPSQLITEEYRWDAASLRFQLFRRTESKL